ncbi:RICIN domain-containing protein [Cellulosimicrobium arenosum]|uniref:RICIN domain-containing protein n=1 Tax=Cellulosimicrobium arenosum TaxID=2708133 RepID=UPI0019D6C8BA|nr:RICIN domain-containing protein [Cellulosimicrobium arenosum]
MATLALGAGGVALTAAPAASAPGPEDTLVVEADQPFREATNMATGSLYGIADEGVPSDDLIAPIKPHTFVQMPPNGRQQPTGDTAKVWRTADRHDAGIVVRIVDYYPGWPYQFSWENTADRKAWEDVIRDVVADVEASGATNIVAYAPWNESDQTWLEQNGTFEELWEFSYDVLREELGPDVPIQGPSFSDNISDMRQFLEFAKETDTVPDVIEWHELIRASKIKGDVENVRGLLEELELGDLPIDITEYASPQEVGLPGRLVGYVAELERFGITRAELPFWNQSGTLGDLLVSRGGAPNGAYWLYTWYADMEGQMVTTTPPSNESLLDGAASVNDAKDEVKIIAGGNSGPTSIVVNGLDELALGDAVNVKLETTPSYGRTTPTPGPITISETTYEVGEDGAVTVPVVMNPNYGYHVVVTSAGEAQSLAGTYTLTNRNSELVLDTADAGTTAGTGVVQAEAGDGETQQWRVEEAGSGLYTIVNVASGLALGVQDASTANGARAIVQEVGEGEDQLWQLVPDPEGRMRLANYGTGLTLGIDQMSTAVGAPVVQWTDGAPTSNCSADGTRQPGKIGTALDFCKTSSYVTLPNGSLGDLDGDWTVSTWVKPASLATWSRVFDLGANSTKSMFFTVSAGSGPRFAITGTGAGGEQTLSYNGQNLSLGQWNHVAITVAGTSGTMYLNGQAVATGQITTSPSELGDTTNRNYLGKSQYGSDPAFDGAIDDFALYGRALSAEEVATLATGEPAEGDVLNYTFDETGGRTVTDSSGNGRDGTVTVGAGAGSTTTATDEETADRFWSLTSVEADDELAVDVVAQPRCVAGRPYLAVRATNTDEVALDVVVSTAHGEKSFGAVEPGKSAYQSFAVRGGTAEAGVATVSVSSTDEQDGRESTVEAAYEAPAC